MQLDPPQNERQVWHWEENISAGVQYLSAIHGDAQNYLNYWYNISVNNSDPNDDWAWDPHAQNSDWIWDDAFARYNTGNTIFSPNGNGGIRNCTNNSAGCNYANSVRGHLTNPPW